MHDYIHRQLEEKIKSYMGYFPAVAVLGPRQCGKSTLVKHLQSQLAEFEYLDLEKPSDRRKLTEPEVFFDAHIDRIVCLDEIQRVPELFPVLRSILDDRQRPGQIIILGSASRDLIKQSSETLAGRIGYLALTPFILSEIADQNINFNQFWLRGGFPDSLLGPSDEMSMEWRINFIEAFLERDIPNLGFSIHPERIRRLWVMLSHYHGSLLNRSKIADSIGVSSNTIQSYIDILEGTFMIRVLRPYEPNLKKRIIKSPKVYVRDSGILHALLELETFNELLGHVQFGASFEGMCIENILSIAEKWRPYFYRTSGGAEIDLVLEKGEEKIAIEFKASKAPSVSRGFWQALDDLKIEEAYIVAPVDSQYEIKKGVKVLPLEDIIDRFSET